MKTLPVLDRTTIQITVNGRPIIAQKGKSILEACREASIFIPTLCYDERLEAYGGCRLCLIEVKGISRPLTACTTPVADGYGDHDRERTPDEAQKNDALPDPFESSQ